MVLLCDDFSFDGKSLKNQGYITVSFDNDTTLPSSIAREMDSSSMNKYRSEEIGFGTTYSETLEFDVHIMKDFCNTNIQTPLEFTPEEYDGVVAWLSSPMNNIWLDITTSHNQKQKVKGYFSSIEPFDNDMGVCYGVRSTFRCNSPFSYVEKTNNQTINGVTNFLLENTSSELYDYVYPTFVIEPSQNEEIFIHNLSDSEILENGVLNITDDASANIALLQEKVNNYADLNNLQVSYVIDPDTQDLKVICNNTGILFYMTDSYGIQKKYIVYYLSTDKQYYICRSGFFYCAVSQSLTITMDCKNLAFYDALGRPVLFTTIGIQDEDEIYWPRLIHGNNSIRVMGNFNLKTTFLEARKGMLI